MRRLLLDTNVVVWLLLGDHDAVPDATAQTLADERNSVFLSAVSVWEIAIKRSIGKLEIEDGWASALARLDFEPMPVTFTHARQVEGLPWHHRDPFDRLLVAQAAAEAHTLVSADANLATYGIEVLW